ncbi:MAG: cytochrome c-type biogenesis protein CcmH [Acidimicrobiales bacterium]
MSSTGTDRAARRSSSPPSPSSPGSSDGDTGGSVDAGPPARSWRRLAWVAVAVAAVALLVVAAADRGGAETDAERIQRLSASYACPQCQGESVAESNAAVAVTIRQFIGEEVSSGATDEQIRDQLVTAYGARVLLNPPATGLGSLVWVLPVMAVVAGAVLVAAMLSRNRPTDLEPTAADRELVAAARRRRHPDPADDSTPGDAADEHATDENDAVGGDSSVDDDASAGEDAGDRALDGDALDGDALDGGAPNGDAVAGDGPSHSGGRPAGSDGDPGR